MWAIISKIFSGFSANHSSLSWQEEQYLNSTLTLGDLDYRIRELERARSRSRLV